MISWRAYRMPLEGLARGYLVSAFHLWQTLHRLTDVADCVCEKQATHDTVLHYCPPHFYQPIPNRRNVLFTMWEGDRLPRAEIEVLRTVHGVIVPSNYCREVFEGYGLRPHVVPLGLPPAYLEQQPPDRRTGAVSFMFLGARTARKGTQIVGPAWRKAFGEIDSQADVYLYMKTISDDDPKIEAHFGGRVTLDSRDLPSEEVQTLYRMHDVFIFPSVGEGFGLPVLEAMASGCLVISTDAGGLAEFVNDETALVLQRSRTVKADYGIEIDLGVPTVAGLSSLMLRAYREWGSPELERIRQNGIEKARGYTWEKSARLLLESLGLTASGSPSPSSI